MSPIVDQLKRPMLIRLAIVAAFLAATPWQAIAATTDVATTPFTIEGSLPVKDNLMFILDDNIKGHWGFLPDTVALRQWQSKYGFASAQCNQLYYDPNVVYTPPKTAAGTLPNSSFTGAWINGYFPALGTRDLRTQFQAWESASTTSGFGYKPPLADDTQQAAYYWAYSGTNTVKDYLNVRSGAVDGGDFYEECDSAIGVMPGKNKFTLVQITGASSAADQQNFANWYSYYRTRINAVKSAASEAFAPIGNSWRIGFTTSSYTGTTNSAGFLSIADFTPGVGGHKESWFAKLHAAVPSASTTSPLRSALAKTGRIYAGQIGADPLQYWCQRNYAFLTAYANYTGELTPPYKENGSAIDNQDSTLPAPKYEGPTASVNSLSDVAAYYYKTDLRNANCSTGVGGADVCKNSLTGLGEDTATHQHMTTFTFGMGLFGDLKYHPNYLTGGSVDYIAIKAGTKQWPVPTSPAPSIIPTDYPFDDLWHAAVNGGGAYWNVTKPTTLADGFSRYLVGLETVQGSGAAASTSNLEPVVGDNLAFTAEYRTVSWDGDIQARTIDLDTGNLSTAPLWSARTLLAAKVSATADTRTIYTFAPAAANKLRNFAAADFTAAEKTLWFLISNEAPPAHVAS